MAKELTLDQARKNSASFLYIFATDEYLKYIPAKYAKVIRGKRANQQKLLMLSAEEYLGSANNYSTYKNAVLEGFKETYGMTPTEALVKLALGENVAGKNWSEGVYGIGAVDVAQFYGTNITVDPETGHIYKDGVDRTDTTLTICNNFGGKIGTIPFQLFANIDSVTYISEYKRKKKKYFAKSYSNASGKYSAANGATIKETDAGSVFENIQLGTWDFLDFLKQLLAFFGINYGNSSKTKEVELINDENTLPNQQADGYVQDVPPLNASAILAAVAAGALIIGKLMPAKKSGKRK